MKNVIRKITLLAIALIIASSCTAEIYTVTYTEIPDETYGLPQNIDETYAVRYIEGSFVPLKFISKTESTSAFDPKTQKTIDGQWIGYKYWKDENGTNVLYFTDIDSDKNVYGKWRFVPEGQTYTITYSIFPDPRYGMPEDVKTPKPETNVPHGSNPKLIVPVTNIVTKQKWAIDVLTKTKISGIWQFSPYWNDDTGEKLMVNYIYAIDRNHEMYGRWFFFPIE